MWRCLDMTRDGGKGDIPRPLGVPMEQFDRNFEVIFGKKKTETNKEEKQDEMDSNRRDNSR